MREKRTHFITVRLTYDDLQKLNEIAKKYKVNRSEAIRILINDIAINKEEMNTTTENTVS